MLIIDVPRTELYDDTTNTFYNSEPVRLRLEHSLVSVSKWESHWGKSFLSNTSDDKAEHIYYIRCMLLTQNVSDQTVEILFANHRTEINRYIAAPMTATHFYQHKKNAGRADIITSELIYYWLIAFNIPFECQRWHLNRLLTLVRVCNIKNSKNEKMDQRSILRDNRAINERRKKAFEESRG